MPKVDSYTPGDKMTTDFTKGQVNMVSYPLRHGYDTTQRYGLIYPFFYHQGLEKDICKNKSTTHLRTLPMRSPSYAKLNFHKSYAFVPTSCILPNNWEKVKKEPAYGDDIPSTDVGCMSLHPLFILEVFRRFCSQLSSSSTVVSSDIISMFWRLWVLNEAVFANKSLMSSLRFPGHALGRKAFTYDDNSTDGYIYGFNNVFDYVFNKFCVDVQTFMPFGAYFSYRGRNFQFLTTSQSDKDVSFEYMPFSDFLDLMRFCPDLVTFFPSDSPTAMSAQFRAFVANIAPVLNVASDNLAGTFEIYAIYDRDNFSFSGVVNPVNLEPLHAYQIACACLYNDDQTDFVLDSALYRGAMLSLYLTGMSSRSNPSNQPIPSFMYNGSAYLYDSLSGKMYTDVLSTLLSQVVFIGPLNWSPSRIFSLLDYLYNVHVFQQSLKFFDLITGGRTRPYSVGNNVINVSGNKVDPVEVAKSLVYQRAQLQFSRIGNDIDDYMKEILSSYPGVDQYHSVQPLGDTQVSISGFEIENNTSEDQGKLVTRIDNVDTFGHCTYQVSLYGVLLGLSYFDCERYYAHFWDTFYLKNDRLDHFNPELQHTGDIPLMRENVDMRVCQQDSAGYESLPFSYIVKDGDYKQSVNFCDGGFLDSLPSWEFVADAPDDQFFGASDEALQLNSSFVRSFPGEFDRFFDSLTHFVEGSRFHFIIHYDNDFECVRNMIPKPELIF